MSNTVGLARLLRSLTFHKGWTDGLRLEVHNEHFHSDSQTVNFLLTPRIAINNRVYGFFVTLETEEESALAMRIQCGALFTSERRIHASAEALLEFGNRVAAPLIRENLYALSHPVAEEIFGKDPGVIPPLSIIQCFGEETEIADIG